MFTLKVPFIIIGKSFEVRGNDECLDVIFKGHILWVIFVEENYKPSSKKVWNQNKLWTIDRSEFLNINIFKTVAVPVFIICKPNFTDTHTWGQIKA